MDQHHDREQGREPCPGRIVEDLGGAFSMGCVGGFIWNFCSGFRNSPGGEKWLGGLYAGKVRAPITGSNFANWGGTFSIFDCTLQALRKKDDGFNAVASGFLTGGVLAIRSGVKQASKSAAIGGAILAVIEGVTHYMFRNNVVTPRDEYLQQLEEQKQAKEKEIAKAKWERGQADNPGWFSGMGSIFTAPSMGPGVISGTEGKSSEFTDISGAEFRGGGVQDYGFVEDKA